MATAALIISVLAVVVAALSALYARQVATVERDRRHDERTPEVTAEFGLLYPEGKEQESVTFTLHGPDDLDRAEIRLIETDPPGPLVSGEQRVEPWRAGETQAVAVKRHEKEHGGTARFRVTCEAGDERWTVIVPCEVPGVPKVHFF